MSLGSLMGMVWGSHAMTRTMPEKFQSWNLL
jgi:hypothetical protein